MNGKTTAYINSAGYAPNGGLLSYFTNNNLLTLNQFYNMHQQVSYLAVASNNNYQGQNYFAQTMDWGSSGNKGVRLNGKKEYISNNAALPSAPTFSQTFSYDGVNRLLSASDTGGWSETYSYAFGQLAAEYYSGDKPTPPCSTCFLTYDYLGNVRMVTYAQANIVARHDFAPFGQEISSGTGGRGWQWGAMTDVDRKFTGRFGIRNWVRIFSMRDISRLR